MTIVQAVFIWFTGFLPLQIQPCSDLIGLEEIEESGHTDQAKDGRENWTGNRRACNADQGDDDPIYNGF